MSVLPPKSWLSPTKTLLRGAPRGLWTLVLAALFVVFAGAALAAPTVVRTPRIAFAVHPDRVAMANELAKDAETVLAEVERQLGASPPERPADAPPEVSVRIVHTEAEFLEAMPNNRTIEWAAGVAFPELGLVVLRINANTRAGIHDVFRHELSHIVLGRTTGHRDLPLWFIEGVAVHQAGERLAERWQRAADATLTESLPLLDTVRDRFPADGTGADFAYAHSTAFVGHLLSRHGSWTGVRTLVAKVRGGLPFEAAFEAAYGHPRAALEAEFREVVARSASWLPVLFGGGLFMAVLVSLVAGALIFRRREARRRIAAMADPIQDEFA